MSDLRPATPDDAAAVVELRREVAPYQVHTAAGVRHWWSTAEERAHLLVLVAEADGAVVAVGWAGFNTWTSEAGAASIVVTVHPERRRAGLGGQLYDRLETHVRAYGGQRAQGWALDEPDTAAWCAARGFEPTHELRFSRLRLDQLPPVPPAPAGVSTVSFAQAGPRAVFAVDSVSTMDEPGDVPVDAMEFDSWHREIWQAPDTDLDASTLVLVDGEPAACTVIEADVEGRRVWSGGTGTLPAFRGRGLAKLAKSVALARAAHAGALDAYTSNDEVNVAMLAVNEWLGYQPCARQWAFLKQL